jgi:hypothetical protein
VEKLAGVHEPVVVAVEIREIVLVVVRKIDAVAEAIDEDDLVCVAITGSGGVSGSGVASGSGGACAKIIGSFLGSTYAARSVFCCTPASAKAEVVMKSIKYSENIMGKDILILFNYFSIVIFSITLSMTIIHSRRQAQCQAIENKTAI